MILWLSVGGLAAIVLLMLLRPLLIAGNQDPASRAEHDIEVFRAQLTEIDRDSERGLLPESEASAARREVERRLLAAGERADQATAMAVLSRPSRIVLGLILLIALPLATTTLYLSLGTPALPGLPFASRPAALQDPAEDEARAALATFEQLILDDPSDPRNWLNLGRVKFSLADYEGSAAAFTQALELTDRHPGALSLYGEALVYAAEGFVTAGARNAFGEALAADPREPRARFYGALADYQAGRREQALDNWLDLATGAPADAVWLPAVHERIRAVATELGRDSDALLATAAPAAPAAPSQALTGDQLERIRGMVAGLAERLAAEPDDLEGWLMLGRSYMVLGQSRKAVGALTQAARLAPDRPQILAA
ncbi:MAG: c-type cytochrome biogenesis protein CcmI, partial [Alphaproteobacteria bacterium]